MYINHPGAISVPSIDRNEPIQTHLVGYKLNSYQNGKNISPQKAQKTQKN
jgi:hypothetical protein